MCNDSMVITNLLFWFRLLDERLQFAGYRGDLIEETKLSFVELFSFPRKRIYKHVRHLVQRWFQRVLLLTIAVVKA